MSASGDVTVHPVRNVLIDDAAEVPYAGNLKNDYPVVVIEHADVQKDGDNLAWHPWGFDNPETLKGFAKINGSLKGVEQAEIIRNSKLSP